MGITGYNIHVYSFIITMCTLTCVLSLFLGPFTPTSLTGFEFGGMAALSDPPSWRRVTSMTQVQQLPQLPETIEEHQESVSGDHSFQGEEEEQLRRVEEDLQSELSFTSAYSHPRDSPKTLQCMETTV